MSITPETNCVKNIYVQENFKIELIMLVSALTLQCDIQIKNYIHSICSAREDNKNEHKFKGTVFIRFAQMGVTH